MKLMMRISPWQLGQIAGLFHKLFGWSRTSAFLRTQSSSSPNQLAVYR